MALTYRQGQTNSLTSQQCQQQLQVQRRSLWSTLDAIGAKKQPHANSQEGCTDDKHDQRCPGHFIPSPVAACNSDPFCFYLAWVNIDVSIAHPNLVITLLSILEDGWSDAKLVCGTQGHILHQYGLAAGLIDNNNLQVFQLIVFARYLAAWLRHMKELYTCHM